MFPRVSQTFASGDIVVLEVDADNHNIHSSMEYLNPLELSRLSHSKLQFNP